MIKVYLISLISLQMNVSVFACIQCNKDVYQKIQNTFSVSSLATLSLAFIVLAMAICMLYGFGIRNKKVNDTTKSNLNPLPLTATASIIGIGVGGFFDGVVFHQLLQWHAMLSNKLPPGNYVNKSVNMFWDGIFHAVCLVVVLTGVILLWQLLKRTDVNTSGRLLASGLFFGWGIFNLIEGSINHHLLKLHNVYEFSQDKNLWNMGFLLVSTVMVVLGCILFLSVKPRKEAQTGKANCNH